MYVQLISHEKRKNGDLITQKYIFPLNVHQCFPWRHNTNQISYVQGKDKLNLIVDFIIWLFLKLVHYTVQYLFTVGRVMVAHTLLSRESREKKTKCV
jgi:hypothetical protein